MIQSFGYDEVIKNKEDFARLRAKAKPIYRQRVPDESDEEFEERWGRTNPLMVVGRDRYAGHKELVKQVARAKQECQQRFPQLTDQAINDLGWAYEYSIWKEGVGYV